MMHTETDRLWAVLTLLLSTGLPLQLSAEEAVFDNWTTVQTYEGGTEFLPECTPDDSNFLDFDEAIDPLRCTLGMVGNDPALPTHLGYGDESGIVRAKVHNDGGGSSNLLRMATHTFWRQVFHKFDDDTSADYTIGNNLLDVSTQSEFARAGTSFSVVVKDLSTGQGYEHLYEMDYIGPAANDEGGEVVTWTSNQQVLDRFAECDGSLQADQCDPNAPVDLEDTTINGWAGIASANRPGDRQGPAVQFGDGISADVSMVVPHTQILDLDMIPVYDPVTGAGRFSVTYSLIAEARGTNDGFIKSYFSDPLDVEGGPADGVALNIPLTAQPSPERTDRLCQQDLDQQRYTVQQDLVLDTHTGLQWQRCPVGYTLTGEATSDLLDDGCVADTGSVQQSDWASAVMLAAENTGAGLGDWRLPDIKELDSIVAECDGRKVDPALFPDTPITAGAFWTSTANADDEAWQVHFAHGDIRPDAVTTPGYARLVRTSGDAPLPDVPALFAGKARIPEGDSSISELRIPVLLSEPASTLTGSITVDYAVTSPNQHATPGVDFEPVSGTLTFAPGDRRQSVAVNIIGDAEVEQNEFLNITLSNPSANSRLGRAINVATIYDDEPTITFAPAVTQFEERNAGTVVEQIPVLLSKPAVAPITVEYDIEAGSAVLGDDADAGSGTVSFAVGEQVAFAEVTVRGDTVVENDESVLVRLRDPIGGRFALGQVSPAQRVVIQNDDGLPNMLAALNDTGVASCADNEFSGVTCPVADFPGQDAEQGRDVDPALNDDSDGVAGFSFTRLDAAGDPMANQLEFYGNNPWFCAEDNVTGLVWEVKTDANTAGLHQATRRFTWHNSSGINDGGDPGLETVADCATEMCDSERYVAAVNAENYCGFNDWRLPTITELLTIFNQNRFPPEPVSHAFFNQNVASGRTTLSSTSALARDSATGEVVGSNVWTISSNGVIERSKSSTTGYQIRLVRGGAGI